jgi:uncharacterized protein involved in exopolysaccharide biosynthesis
MPLLGGPIMGGIAPETINIDMLLSRRVGERVIDEFDLMDRWNFTIVEDALKRLHSHLGFTLLENGLLKVTYEDRDPRMAADVLNQMIEELDNVHGEIAIGRAARSREFIGEQLGLREEMLYRAEEALKQFQKENEALELDEQLRAAMDLVAELTGEAIALETELEILSKYASTTSEEYVRKQREYEVLVGELRKLKVGDGAGDEDMVRSYIPRLDEMPDLVLDYVRLKRQVEIESNVYTMLVKEFEKARIEEARDSGNVQILDPAVPPSLRSRPRRTLLVLVGGIFGLAWSVMLSLMLQAWRENPERSSLFRQVLAPIVRDFQRVFRRG